MTDQTLNFYSNSYGVSIVNPSKLGFSSGIEIYTCKFRYRIWPSEDNTLKLDVYDIGEYSTSKELVLSVAQIQNAINLARG